MLSMQCPLDPCGPAYNGFKGRGGQVEGGLRRVVTELLARSEAPVSAASHRIASQPLLSTAVDGRKEDVELGENSVLPQA